MRLIVLLPQIDTPQRLAALELELAKTGCENQALKLEILRWRKDHSVLRLKLAGSEECSELTARHCDLLASYQDALARQNEGLVEQLGGAEERLQQLEQELRVRADEAAAMQVCVGFKAMW